MAKVVKLNTSNRRAFPDKELLLQDREHRREALERAIGVHMSDTLASRGEDHIIETAQKFLDFLTPKLE